MIKRIISFTIFSFLVLSSNCSAVIIEDMTADNAPSPFVASAENSYGGFPPWAAFDRDTGTFWMSSGGIAWLQIDIGTGATVGSYEIQCRTDAHYITAWTLNGSNTGAFVGEETALDSQTAQDTRTKKTYTISSPSSFRYYRINTSAIDGSFSSVMEFQLLEALTSRRIITIS